MASDKQMKTKKIESKNDKRPTSIVISYIRIKVNFNQRTNDNKELSTKTTKK
jgi:hypothetical protein